MGLALGAKHLRWVFEAKKRFGLTNRINESYYGLSTVMLSDDRIFKIPLFCPSRT
jgi:hypothetical protein